MILVQAQPFVRHDKGSQTRLDRFCFCLEIKIATSIYVNTEDFLLVNLWMNTKSNLLSNQSFMVIHSLPLSQSQIASNTQNVKVMKHSFLSTRFVCSTM